MKSALISYQLPETMVTIMSEKDFEVIETSTNPTAHRNIRHEQQAKIARDIAEFLSTGGKIEMLESNVFHIDRHKRTSASNTHLFRSKKNAQNN